MDTTQILYLVGAFVLGFVIAWFAGRGGPKRAAEEAAAETQSVRSKLRTVESDLQKTQGQHKENLASLDQLSAEKSNLVAMLKTSEASLTDAGAEIQRLTTALGDAHSDGLLLQTELSQARSALGEARTQVMALTAALDAAAEVAEEVEETAIVEHAVNDELAARMTELESELALARATADRLAEKQVLVSAELYLKRREYSDIIGAGDDAIVSALATRDQALFEAQTEMDYMRRDLSMLTAAGAQLADALQKRSEDYEGLMHRLVTSETAVRALPEVSLATATAAVLVEKAVSAGEDVAAEETAAPEAEASADEAPAQEAPAEAVVEDAGPDLAAELEARAAELDELKSEHENLKAALDAAIAERDDLKSQLDARATDIDDLTGKLSAANEQVATLSSANDTFVAQLKERSTVIDGLLAKIGDFDGMLRSLLPAIAAAAAGNGVDAESSTEASTGEEAVPAFASEEEEGETDVN
ncbi:MAG: hypothetical protein KIT77_10210 [Caldilinea sp.]|nr:hypothetical protein [Caldilineaceae bacterium]MCB9117518.1 hypothetical protein [Caldilineaceae bacterium]MCB9119955.1 hypothetical protein [Caldilineaceae bacterium]MCW5841604.1 hypothetical protein [Caldilinea sp.]